jgi:hypothetical protein
LDDSSPTRFPETPEISIKVMMGRITLDSFEKIPYLEHHNPRDEEDSQKAVVLFSIMDV